MSNGSGSTPFGVGWQPYENDIHSCQRTRTASRSARSIPYIPSLQATAVGNDHSETAEYPRHRQVRCVPVSQEDQATLVRRATPIIDLVNQIGPMPPCLLYGERYRCNTPSLPASCLVDKYPSGETPPVDASISGEYHSSQRYPGHRIPETFPGAGHGAAVHHCNSIMEESSQNT